MDRCVVTDEGERQMKKTVSMIGILVAALALTLTADERQAKKDSPTVGGNWTMTVKAQGAHGEMTASLALTQQGKKITGRFVAHGSDRPIAGEFADAKLKVATTDGEPDSRITLTASLKDDNTLAGYVSGPMGDLQWTAVRAKAK